MNDDGKPMYKFFHILSLFLVLISSYFTCLLAKASEHCDGNFKFMHTTPVTSSDDHYQRLHKHFTGCKYVHGDLTIVNIGSSLTKKYDLSFLENITEISGALSIVNVSVTSINLKRLRVIRGEGLIREKNLDIDNITVALRIWSNWHSSLSNRVIDLSGLRSIMQGDVHISSNMGNCFIHSQVNYEELFENPDEQQLHHNDDTRNCVSQTQCHATCPQWPTRGRNYCWGPTPQLCQTRNKCRTNLCQAVNLRCFNDVQCCHSECVGGCTGSGSDKCVACRNFKDGLHCVNVCPSKTYYDKSTKRNLPNPNFKLTYGPFCLLKCPSSYLKENGFCVKSCSMGYKINALGDECEYCKENCEKLCKLTPAYQNTLTRLDLPSLINCTTIEVENLVISKNTLDKRKNGITFDQLTGIFKTVRRIQGSLEISYLPSEVHNLSFLRNVVQINGNFKLRVLKRSNFSHLGFQRLNSVRNIVLMEYKHLCGNWLPTSLNKFGIIRNNFSKNFAEESSQCQQARCHDECEPSEGCWGPTDAMCVKCRNLKAGDHCVNQCEVKAYYTSSSNTTCLPCHKECASSCTGPNDYQCSTCRQYKIGKSCVSSCPKSHFADNVSMLCLPCPKACPQDCTGNKTIVGPNGCTSCSLVHLISNATQQSVRCLESECDKGFYEAIIERSNELSPNLKSARQCLRCNEECSSCKYGADFCTSCPNVFMSGHTIRCYDKCPLGTFTMANSSECQRCSSGCTKCFGNGTHQCEQCDELYLYENLLTPVANYSDLNFTCVNTCPAHFPIKKYDPNSQRKLCVDRTHSLLIDNLNSSKKSSIVWIISCVVAFFMAGSLITSCFFMRQRTLAKRDVAKYLHADIIEEFIPLKPSNAVPNMTKLLIIKESELRRFERPIGSGAFGTVYQGLWIPSDANVSISVAIKVLSESSFSEELLDEVKIMASIQHPCCVRLLCVCMTSQLQLISQLMPLGSLLDYMHLNTKKIGSKYMLLWASQIASGMNHLEQCGIIHRDLAARNVLVQSPNQVKITDFGLAKMLDMCESDFLATSGKLPVKWLALESLQHKIFNFKTDVWAFGVTLWEIFTFGQRPYENIRVCDLCDFLEKGERLPQPGICTLDVYMLMIKCWMLDADSRPSFHDLQMELQKMASDPGRFIYIPGDPFARALSVEDVNPRDIFITNIVDNPEYSCDLRLIEPDEYLMPTINKISKEQPDNTSSWSFTFLDRQSQRKKKNIPSSSATDRNGCTRYTSDPCISEMTVLSLSKDNDVEDYLIPKKLQELRQQEQQKCSLPVEEGYCIMTGNSDLLLLAPSSPSPDSL